MAAISDLSSFSGNLRFCSKCCRKLGEEGKGLRKALKKAVRAACGEAVELEKTDCFSLCPKGGQVVAAFPEKSPRRLVILTPDSDARQAVGYLLASASAKG